MICLRPAHKVSDVDAQSFTNKIMRRDVQRRLGIIMPAEQTVHLTVQRNWPQVGPDQSFSHFRQRRTRPTGMRLCVGGSNRTSLTPADGAVFAHQFDQRGVKRPHFGIGHGVGAIFDRQFVGVDVNFANLHGHLSWLRVIFQRIQMRTILVKGAELTALAPSFAT